jgi:hypothetical protein
MPGRLAFDPMIKALTVEWIKAGPGNKVPLSIAKQIIREHEDAVFAAAREELDEEWQRWFLWEVCTHDMKYGDDGEMQCHGTDFKRDQMWLLQQHVSSAIGDRNKDLTDLRAANIDLTVRLSDSEGEVRECSKRIQVLEDLLNNIYRGPIGFAYPRDTDIIQIGKELGIR